MIAIAYFIGVFSSAVAEDKLLNLQKLSEKLEKRQAELNEREAQLNERENTLKILKKEIDTKQTELDMLRVKLDNKLNEIKKVEDENLEQLSKIYSSTKAKSAAEVISKMELRKAVSLFQRMPARAAGKVLTSMAKIDPLFASKISEELTPDKEVIK